MKKIEIAMGKIEIAENNLKLPLVKLKLQLILSCGQISFFLYGLCNNYLEAAACRNSVYFICTSQKSTFEVYFVCTSRKKL